LLCADRSSGPLLPDVTMAEIEATGVKTLNSNQGRVDCQRNLEDAGSLTHCHSYTHPHTDTLEQSLTQSLNHSYNHPLTYPAHSTQLTVLSSQHSAYSTQLRVLAALSTQLTALISSRYSSAHSTHLTVLSTTQFTVLSSQHSAYSTQLTVLSSTQYSAHSTHKLIVLISSRYSVHST
jgi:hypothetical protein